MGRRAVRNVPDPGLTLSASSQREVRMRKLAGLFSASSLFQSRMSDAGNLASVARQVAQAMGAGGCVVARWTDGAGAFRPLSVYGLNGSGKADLRTALDDPKGFFSWVLRYQRAFRMGGSEKNLKRYVPSLLQEERTRSILAIPLSAAGEKIGVLGLFDGREDFFDGADESLLSMFSAQVAMAVKNDEMFSNVKRDFLQTVKAFAAVIDFNDNYTHDHSERVMNYSALVCDRYPLKAQEKENILYGSFLHDVGKIGVQTAVLRKPGKLNEVEWEQMVAHAQIGADIVNQIEFLKPLAPCILYHHAWYGGGGYPDPNLCGDDIPLGARILCVTDAYEAMTSDRVYRRAMDHETAADQLRRFSGRQFDPDVVEAFLSAMD